jgi:hypothetical protein
MSFEEGFQKIKIFFDIINYQGFFHGDLPFYK